MKDVARANYNGKSEFERRLNGATIGEIARRFQKSDDEGERSVLLDRLVSKNRGDVFLNATETFITNSMGPYPARIDKIMTTIGIIRTPLLEERRINEHYYTDFVVIEPVRKIGNAVCYSREWADTLKNATLDEFEFERDDSCRRSFWSIVHIRYRVRKNNEAICSITVEGCVLDTPERYEEFVRIVLCPVVLEEEGEKTVIASDVHEFFSYDGASMFGCSTFPGENFNDRFASFQEEFGDHHTELCLKYRYDRKSAFEAYLSFLRRFSFKFGADEIPGIDYAMFMESRSAEKITRSIEKITMVEEEEEEWFPVLKNKDS